MAQAVTRLLVANRGEIAIRIFRTCRALGIETVAIYSDADADAPHVRAADQAVRVGPTPAPESYLSIERVLEAAATSGADAIHPGYGFLSENPAFAEACATAGITFVGPSAAAMRALGDKDSAKLIAAKCDVPTVPTYDVDNVPDDAFPVLVKAAAGGGGRGMRVVRNSADLAEAVEGAGREALAGFGNATLLVEKLVENAKHVEVQLLADQHGACVYVGDRDCSLQRRHQKVVEEAPAPGLSDDLRAALGEAAVRLALHAGYAGAGTAEFLVDTDGGFYFLELNARLQVEHPVSELVFGLDLVQLQLQVAQGRPLGFGQAALKTSGCAIEARLYAEDPVSFLPTGGRVLLVEIPEGPGIRVDHAIAPGMEVSLAYDPLLAKVIAHGASREDARERLLGALRETVVLGVVTNQALLQHALQLPPFVSGIHATATLEGALLDQSALEPPAHLATAARRSLRPQPASTFERMGPWRLGGPQVPKSSSARMPAASAGDRIWFAHAGIAYEIPRDHIDPAPKSDLDGDQSGRAHLTAPMPGTVIQVTEVGTPVSAGDAVVVLEAMKMENSIAAPFDGVVDSLACEVGDLVSKGTQLAEVTR